MYDDQNFVLDVENMPSGIYQVQIVQHGSVYNQKFVKK